MGYIPSGFGQPLYGQPTGGYYPGQVTPTYAPIQPVYAPPPQVANPATQNALASIAASNAADQAAQQVFLEWQMRTGDEQLALQKAQQAWSHTFQERQQAFSEGVTEAGLTGTYEGQQTQQAQQQQWQQGNTEQQQQASNALALLGLQAGMQGPRDWARYQQLNANTPGGLQQLLQGFAGRYGFAGSGAQGTPGGATLQSRTQDLLSGGQLGQGGQQQTAQPTAGATPAQNGYALPAPNQINLRNWSAASPSQQQMLLGGYEAAGYYGPDVEREIAMSAPRYAGPSTTQVGF